VTDSANVELVRSIYAPMERGDFSHADWAHPEIECVMVGGPEPGSGSGLAAMATGWGEVLGAWEDFRVEVDDYREVDDERLLALIRFSGRGKTSGLEIATKGAALFQLHDGKVDRIVHYWDRDRALAELGLEEQATPDLEESVRRSIDALNRRDFDAAVAVWAPDAVWELAPLGFGVFAGGHLIGHEAIRKSQEDLTEAFADFESELEDHRDFGRDVTFGVLVQRGRPHGSEAFVEARGGVVAIWRDARIARATSYQDLDEARAAAERLAQERGG